MFWVAKLRTFWGPWHTPWYSWSNKGVVARSWGPAALAAEVCALCFTLTPALLPRPVEVQIFLSICHEWRNVFSKVTSFLRAALPRQTGSKCDCSNCSQGRELTPQQCACSSPKYLELLVFMVHEITFLTSSPGHTDRRGRQFQILPAITWLWKQRGSPESPRTDEQWDLSWDALWDLFRKTCQKESQRPITTQFLAWGNLLYPRLVLLITHSLHMPLLSSH